MRSIKTQYFLSYAVTGSVLPYASVYLQWRGLDDSQVGWVIGVGGMSTLLMPAIMSLLADLRLENRVLLRVVFAGSVAALCLLLASTRFIWLLPAFLLWSFSFAPMMSLIDGLLFSVRGQRDAAGKTTSPYHHIRVFGTMGFIAPSLVLYFVMAGGDDSVVRYALVGGIGAALLAATCTFRLPHVRGAVGGSSPRPEVPDPQPTGKNGKAWPTMLALRAMLQPDVALFCAVMWLAQVATAAYYTFYPLYLTREIGVADQWLGLISSVGVVLEIGYVLSLGWLLKKLGVRWLLILGLAGVLVRMSLLWLVPTLGVAVGTQALHGLTVLAIFVLPPLYINHRAEAGYRNSMQGLYAMLVYGTGRVLGSVLAGQVSDVYEQNVLMPFAVAAGLAAVALVLTVLFFRDRSGEAVQP